MPTASEAAVLRIHIDYNDVYQGRPLADALILKAQELHLAAALAIEGIIGYSRSPLTHSIELILARDRPVVVELVDRRERLDAYIAAVEPMLPAVNATIEPVTLLRFGTFA